MLLSRKSGIYVSKETCSCKFTLLNICLRRILRPLEDQESKLHCKIYHCSKNMLASSVFRVKGFVLSTCIVARLLLEIKI